MADFKAAYKITMAHEGEFFFMLLEKYEGDKS